MTKKIKSQDVNGRIELLKVMPYKGHQTYLLRVDKDMFVWLVSKSPVFLGHMVFTPGKNGKPLTENQVAQAGAAAFAGAITTVDMQVANQDPETQPNIKSTVPTVKE